MDTKDDATTQEPEPIFHLFLSGYALPLYGWMGFSVWILAHQLPWWGALPLGLPLGFVLWLVTGKLMGDGNTLVEITVGSTIGLVLALILVPVFSQARDKVQLTRCREALKATPRVLPKKLWLAPNWLPLYTEPDNGHRFGAERGHHVVYASGRVGWVRDPIRQSMSQRL